MHLLNVRLHISYSICNCTVITLVLLQLFMTPTAYVCMPLLVHAYYVFLLAEMASAEMASADVQVYQNYDYVTASIKANYPQSKFFTARFTDNGFTVSADG